MVSKSKVFGDENAKNILKKNFISSNAGSVLKSPVHEGAFRLVYKDYNSSFNDLLVKDNASRNHRSLQEKAFEIFKLRLSIALEVVKDNF